MSSDANQENDSENSVIENILSKDLSTAYLISSSCEGSSGKRIRRKGKYTPEERDVIRRERNRIHAKKTRDRKKVFLENSEHTIVEMEKDARLLREYLLNKNLITSAEYNDMKNKEIQCHKELISLRKVIRFMFLAFLSFLFMVLLLLLLGWPRHCRNWCLS